MTRNAASRLIDFLLQHATAIIFVAVFVFFGAQSLNFFGSENVGTCRSRRPSPA